MEALLARSKKKLGLVVGGEALSRIVDWTDRSTCILFGDGAGAVLVKSGESWPSIGALVGCAGSDMLEAPGPGAAQPGYIGMDGAKVFRFAVETVPACIAQVLESSGCTAEEVDAFVLHQANARIIDLVAKKCGLPPEKCVKNIAQYGNTSAASIPIALSEWQEAGRLGPGSRVLLAGFGGGMTWGCALAAFD